MPLQNWKVIGAADGEQDQLHLRLLKVFAEMTLHCGTLEKPAEKVDAIFNVLQVSIRHKILLVKSG